ncbi:hypothetical protein CHS0354_029375 [Potamilus streckersoni]|uniref:Pleckstrin homology domain-containing family H member 1 n=1 Tax=Potamilus streckersoni TaxID=2493646 RepID=A0AAE0STI0_9BIVA|nr:hypothetical protein CHS0354_029375 [Potamilus streckersoni]
MAHQEGVKGGDDPPRISYRVSYRTYLRMKDLEEKRVNAELRAEKAEGKLRMMEQQLAAINWGPQDFERHIQELEHECLEKEQHIQDLQNQLEEQRQLRIQDAKTVEEKATRIKEWVTSKLTQLENQNHELQLENEILNDQTELLRERLQALPAITAREMYRLSQEDVLSNSSASSYLGSRPSSHVKSKSDVTGSRSTLDKIYARSRSEGQNSQLNGRNNGTNIECRDSRSRSQSASRPVSQSQVTCLEPDSEVVSPQEEDEEIPVFEDQPKVHKRPSSSIIEALQMEQEFLGIGMDEPFKKVDQHVRQTRRKSPDADDENISIDEGSDDSMADIDHDPLYQEVDQNHESTYEPKRLNPPQVKIERKIFQDVSRMDSLVSSSNESEDMLERMAGFAFNSKRPIMHVGPFERDSLAGDTPDIDSFDEGPIDRSSGIMEREIVERSTSPIHSSPLNLSPRSHGTQMTPITLILPDVVSSSPQSPPRFFTPDHGSSNVSAIATLPRVRRAGFQPPSVHFDYEDSVITQLERQHPVSGDSRTVMAEVHSAPATVTRHPSSSKDIPPAARGRARFNTWDSKAYPVVHRRRPKTDVVTDVKNTLSEPVTASSLFKDISVPVYATLKGKAAQIRSMPFTEDSISESSDDEGGSVGDSIDDDIISPTSAKMAIRDGGRKQHLNQSSSGATKRGVSHESSTSEISCDYADPPDGASSRSDSENSEPEQKLLKYAGDKNKCDMLDKCGYLSKLGGKVKTWKKRWFVLRNGELLYYKSQHDVLRKPQGSIKLDEKTRINRSKEQLTFEITNSKRTYYLTADTHSETDRWVRVLQKVLKRQATSFLLDQVETKAVIKGNLTKVKNGVTRKCWCVLLGRYFLYYKTTADKTPFGQIHLQDARLEDVDTSCDSDDDSDTPVERRYVVAIWPSYQRSPTYLIMPTRQEKNSWLYHLTVAAGGGTGNVGTDYEQLIAKLMEVDGDAHSVYWKHPVLLHAKDPTRTPLTTLPSVELQRKAVELFQTVYQFMTTLIESQNVEFHVNLAQSALQMCVEHPELQNELYCQLIKQTSRHPVQNRSAVQNLLLCGKHSWYLCHTPTSPTNSVMDLTDSRLNPATFVLMQGWQLLSMCVSLFLPKQSIMWLLKVHLQRNAEPRSEIGKYAIFCQRALERTILKGLREAKPSRMEVLSILLRHPYHHSQPLSIPVHFLNNNYQVVSFDGSTTVQEFLHCLGKILAVRDCLQSGFALFSDDPAKSNMEYCLQKHIKVCDVISKWEEAFREHHSGKLDTSKTIRLLYKNRLYLKSTSRFETEKEKLLLTYQVNDEIINGQFPLNRDLALELASLMAQIEFGDLKTPDSAGNSSSIGLQISTALDRFFPKKYRLNVEDGDSFLIEKLRERWASLRGRSTQDCVRVYLAVARKWQFCGARLFLTRVRDWTASPDDVWLAIQEEGVSVLEYSTMQPISSYDYRSVVTFGGWNEDLMIVVHQLVESAPHHYEHRTEKLLFILPKSKVLEATLLIASYINIRVQRPSQEGNGIV